MSTHSIRNHTRLFATLAIAAPAVALGATPAAAQVRATPVPAAGSGPRVTPVYHASQTGFPEAANLARASSARRNTVVILTPLAIIVGVILIVLLL